MTHGIIIPCYNESSRLDLTTFIAFAKANKSSVLCLVNDGSADMTRSTLAEIKNNVHENVYVVHVEANAGKANAVRQGARFLYKETDVETIGFLDADLSTSFEDYHTLVTEMVKHEGKIKVIFGSRNMGKGSAAIERNPLRKLLSNIIKVLIRLITKLKIEDTQCGAKVFHRSLVPLAYGHSFYTRWLFDVEILMRLKMHFGKNNFQQMFIEQPLQKWVHMDDSKLGLRDSVMIPWNLFSIWREYVWMPYLVNQLRS